jgi:hypothetical protein
MTDTMIQHYLDQMEEEADDRIHLKVGAMDEAAVTAFAHHVDGVATLADLCAYRAWIARHRLEGVSEHELRTSVAVADDMAKSLGVA